MSPVERPCPLLFAVYRPIACLFLHSGNFVGNKRVTFIRSFRDEFPKKNWNMALSQRLSTSMCRKLMRLAVAISVASYLLTGATSEARSLMDFFKAIGDSIAHPQKKQSKSRPKSTKGSGTTSASPTPIAASPVATPPGQQNVRMASLAPPTKGETRDSPYAVPVPGKKGLVTSPFAPDAGYIDVSKFPPGTEVKDPFSGKIFRTP